MGHNTTLKVTRLQTGMSGLPVFPLKDETLLCWCPAMPEDESEINSNFGACHYLNQDEFSEAQRYFGR